MAASVVPAPPLDVLGAETQGQIGYLLANALNDAFIERGKRREIAVIVTRTVVAGDDPAFGNPTKPVGPIYDEETAREHAPDPGLGHRPGRNQLAACGAFADSHPDPGGGGNPGAGQFGHPGGRVRRRGSARRGRA